MATENFAGTNCGGFDEGKILDLYADELRAFDSLVEFRRVFMPEKDDVAPAAFHEEWSDILLHGKNNFAIEAFRESAKTQIVIRANLLHALAFPQAHRSFIVIICATQDLASKRLQEASREFKANDNFKSLVKNIIEDRSDAFEVHYRGGEKVRIEAYGKTASMRGLLWGTKRPDIVVIDDPQDEDDARSEAVTDADWDRFLSDVYFLGQHTRIFLIGNNLGERCIIERILRDPDRVNFQTRRIPILLNDTEGQEVSAWPSKWPVEQIVKERGDFSALGKLDVWYRNKMCKSISPESQKFRREMFRYYDSVDTSRMSIYTTVDLAISQKRNADNSAVVTMGVNEDGHWFVLDIEFGHYDPSQTIDAIFSAVRRWKPLTVGIEMVAYQRSLEHFIRQEMPKRGVFFGLTPLKAEKAKNLRIDTMQPRFMAGSVWFKRDAPWLEKLEGELLAYPHGAHDDVIDALAYMEQIANIPIKSASNSSWDDMPIAGCL